MRTQHTILSAILLVAILIPCSEHQVTSVIGTKFGSCSGDPHISTFDGLKFDCQGTGEFILSKSLTSTFQVQARFSERVSTFTLNQGVVVTLPSAPTVQISIATRSNSLISTVNNVNLVFFVNGVARRLASGSGSSLVSVRTVGSKVVIFYIRSGVRVECAPARFNGRFYLADIRVQLPPSFLATQRLVGLLGTANGNPFTDWTDRLGTVLPPPRTRDERLNRRAFDYSVRYWSVSSTETLFTYETGTSFSTFVPCDTVFRPVLLPPVPNNIQQICGLDAACALDGTFGGVDAARAAVQVATEIADLRSRTSILSLQPSSVRATVTTTVRFTVNVNGRPASEKRGLTSFALYLLNGETGQEVQFITELRFTQTGIYTAQLPITGSTVGGTESFKCIPRFGTRLDRGSPLSVISIGALLILA